QNAWNLDASLQVAREAVLLAETSSQPDALSRALLRLGRTQRSLDAQSDWNVSYERAAKLVDDVEDAYAVAMAMGGLSEYQHGVRRDFRAALHYALVAADLGATSGDRVAQLDAQLRITGTYLSDDDYAMAIVHFGQAIALAHAANVTSSVP